MSNIPGTTRAQTIFLRAFRSPAGPPAEAWPAPSVLRRWLRRPRFQAALDSVQKTLRFQTNFHLSSAAAHAARTLTESSPTTPKALADLLRLAYLRDRFAQSTEKLQPFEDDDNYEDEEEPEPIDLNDPAIIRQVIFSVPPERRLTEAEFKKLAFQKHYASPLRPCADFPDPAPANDPFYTTLLQDPCRLLYYLKLYTERTNDHRFDPILLNCKHLMPREGGNHPEIPLRPFGSP